MGGDVFGRPAAIKTLLTHVASASSQVERFIAKASMAARKHPEQRHAECRRIRRISKNRAFVGISKSGRFSASSAVSHA
jgi:hypothetical protein